MGTRSTTRIYEITDGASPSALKKLKPLLALYRQMDGYPSGMGKDLADFIKGITIVNGISGGMGALTHANGAGCFAAQLVKHLKEGIGSVYVIPTNSGDEEYNYHIYVQAEDKYSKKIQSSLILVRVVDCDKKEIFNGTAAQFAVWCDKDEH